jgi:hypothetical protein
MLQVIFFRAGNRPIQYFLSIFLIIWIMDARTHCVVLQTALLAADDKLSDVHVKKCGYGLKIM